MVLATYYEHSVDSQAIAEAPNLAKHVVLTVLAMFAASEFSTETRLAVRYRHPSIALCTPMGGSGLSDSQRLAMSLSDSHKVVTHI